LGTPGFPYSRLAAWSSVRSTVERGSTADDIVLCVMDVMRSSMERRSELFFLHPSVRVISSNQSEGGKTETRK
ncbi:Hypothetical predicted protein, partial [Pelobates cultripes]